MKGRCVFLSILVATTAVAYGQLTLLDPTFGNNGQVLQGLSGFGGDYSEDVIIQPDGRIIVVGKMGGLEESMAVLRYLENGVLDNSFSGNGVATLNVGVNTEGRAAALQMDGSILVVGSVEFAGGSFDDIAFARFDSSGSLDSGFAGDGVFTYTQPGASDQLLAVAVQPDGRVLGMGNFSGSATDMTAVRLTSDGGLDPTFADGGIFTTTLHTGEVATSLLLRPDGRILLGGAWRLALPDADMAMLQLTGSGVPDPGFGTLGLFRPSEDLSTSSVVTALGADEDRILIAGKRFLPGGSVQEEVFTGRVMPDGTWDTTYGTDGRSFLPLSIGYTGSLRDMVKLPGGKALLTIDALDANSNPAIMVMRVLEDGGLDATFGTSGRVVMPCPGTDCHVRSIALDNEGRVVAAGIYFGANGWEVLVMRWLADASLVGVAEPETETTFRVYPVPASDAVRIDVPSAWLTGARFELMDAFGRLIAPLKSAGVPGQPIELPVTLADGRYVMRLVSGSRVMSAPVVLLR